MSASMIACTGSRAHGWICTAVALLLGACDFHAFAAAEPPPDPDAALAGPALDAAKDAAIDARMTPPPPPPQFCDSMDPKVIACFEFEDSIMDGSSHRLSTQSNNISFVAGKVGKALVFGSNSAADVVDNAAFNVAQLTMESWVQVSQLPATGQRFGVIDVDNQYSLFIYEGGNITCSLAGLAATAPAAATLNTWHHVACSYNGSTAVLYIDGVPLSTVPNGTSLGTGGTSGMSIAADNPPGNGSRLIGMIDQVRLLNTPRSADDICRDAGRTNCPLAP